jgi:hypothetical protein
MISVFLAGEGRNELGTWARDPTYRSKTADGVPRPGVLESLLRKVRPEGWATRDAILWKHIRKLRVQVPGKADERNVRALILMASEAGCQVAAFSRDTDGHSEVERHVEAAITDHEQHGGGSPRVVGGTANPKLVAWILALKGEHHSEDRGHLQERLEKLGVGAKDGPAMVAVVEQADLSAVPEDAHSLLRWLARAKVALPGS